MQEHRHTTYLSRVLTSLLTTKHELFVLPILTGTNAAALFRLFAQSSFRPYSIALPALTEQNILDTVAELSPSTTKAGLVPEAKALFQQSGGIPRLLMFLLVAASNWDTA